MEKYQRFCFVWPTAMYPDMYPKIMTLNNRIYPIHYPRAWFLCAVKFELNYLFKTYFFLDTVPDPEWGFTRHWHTFVDNSSLWSESVDQIPDNLKLEFGT